LGCGGKWTRACRSTRRRAVYIAEERVGGEPSGGEQSSARGTRKSKTNTWRRRRCLARRVGLITPHCRRPAVPDPRDQQTHFSAVSWSMRRCKASVTRKTHFSSSSSLDLLPSRRAVCRSILAGDSSLLGQAWHCHLPRLDPSPRCVSVLPRPRSQFSRSLLVIRSLSVECHVIYSQGKAFSLSLSLSHRK